MVKVRPYIAVSLSLLFLFSACDSITDSGNNNNYSSGPEAQSPDKQTGKTSASATESDIWVGAYFASWNHYAPPGGNWGHVQTDEIDWDAFTHMYYFALLAQSDGSLTRIADYENMSPDRINTIVEAAHQNNTPILFTVGGWGNYDGFSSAIEPANRAAFIANLVETMTVWGFDGIDLDMEPIRDRDVDNYKALVKELHTVLSTLDTPLTNRPLLTAALMGSHAGMFADLHEYFDQINLMTYDYSGAWEGWVSWHNSPLFSDGNTFPGMNRELPSTEGTLNSFLDAGVPAEKLGIGIDFYGYVWHGQVDAPLQDWNTAPNVEDNVSYYDIMNEYYSEESYNYDAGAVAAWLGISSSDPSQRKFISYDDERVIREKIRYARERGIGGTIIWELGGGHRADQPAGQRDKLLQAVKDELHNGSSGSTPPPVDDSSPEVTITSPANGTTISGTVDITVEATSDQGIEYVELLIDGSSVEQFFSNPYSYSWDTGTVSDGTYSINAIAVDNNGTSKEYMVNVSVSNSGDDDSTPPATGGHTTIIYGDQLASPWVDASWSASVNYGSTENSYSGNRSIKVDQETWGALSMRKGDWGNGQDAETGNYDIVEFAVFAQNQDASFSIRFENDQGQSFPRINTGTAQAGQWTVIQVPVDELNPNGQAVNRLNILEDSGSPRSYFVDAIGFISGDGSGGDGSDGPPVTIDAPDLLAPGDGETGVGTSPTFTWTENPLYYHLQVARDSGFQDVVEDRSNLTTGSYQVNGLSDGSDYFWRVKGIDQDGNQSEWSIVRRFSTESNSMGHHTDIYTDQLESPWINASWSASVDFSNSEQVHSGSQSIKVDQNAWGALSLHNGDWGNPQNIKNGQYEAVEFVVYATRPQTSISVQLEDPNGGSMPQVDFGRIQQRRWITISIPMSELNPQNLDAYRISIKEVSGSAKTFYIDDIRLVK